MYEILDSLPFFEDTALRLVHGEALRTPDCHPFATIMEGGALYWRVNEQRKAGRASFHNKGACLHFAAREALECGSWYAEAERYGTSESGLKHSQRALRTV